MGEFFRPFADADSATILTVASDGVLFVRIACDAGTFTAPGDRFYPVAQAVVVG